MKLTKLSPEHLVAHRGHQNCFPENSVLAILDAIAVGAQKIEFDIQFTADGAIALYHDDDMQRISGVEKNITKLTKDELSHYAASEPKRLGSRFANNPIEFLEDILSIITKHQQVEFFLEIKEESLNVFGEDACFSNVKKALPLIPDNLICISFDISVVKRAKQEGFKKTALVFRNWDNRNSLLADANADFGIINYTRIPLQEMIKAEKPILVYEVKHQLIAKQLLDRGAAAVETFCIRSLLNNL